MSERRDNRENSLAELRKKQDERRNEYYKKLEERAKTEEQKEAVLKFESQIEAAVKTRRAAVDAAIAAFQKGMDDAIAQKTDSAEAAAAAFQSAVQAAFSQGQSDCESGIDPEHCPDNSPGKNKERAGNFSNGEKRIRRREKRYRFFERGAQAGRSKSN